MNSNPAHDWKQLARDVFDIEIKGLEAVREHIDETLVEAVTVMAQCTGRVVITGIGKSGLVGRKIAATLSSTGTPSFFMHPVEGAHGDMGMLRQEDVVLALSNSGGTDELNAILPTLKSLGVTIISMTGNVASQMAQLSDIVIPVAVPCEACRLGIAPTTSTTAQLAMGDALAVCLMEWKAFDKNDFKKFHPGGTLGQRLATCVNQLMHTENIPLTLVNAPFEEALKTLNQGGLGLVAIVDAAHKLQGVFTDGDVRREVCAGKLELDRSIAEVMTRSPKRAFVRESAAQVLDVMEQNEITVLPVVEENGILVGLIHLHDLLGKGTLRFSKSGNKRSG